MTFGKAEIREGVQLLVDTVGDVPGEAVQFAHAPIEPVAQTLHLLRRSLGAHRPAQLIGLRRGESGDVDGHLHQLLLEQRDPEGAFERFLEARMVVDDGFEAVAPTDVRMHGSALDGPRADQRHLDDEIVEMPRFQPRQCRHLRARLHLEHADRIRAAQHLVYGFLRQVELREIDVDASCSATRSIM